MLEAWKISEEPPVPTSIEGKASIFLRAFKCHLSYKEKNPWQLSNFHTRVQFMPGEYGAEGLWGLGCLFRKILWESHEELSMDRRQNTAWDFNWVPEVNSRPFLPRLAWNPMLRASHHDPGIFRSVSGCSWRLCLSWLKGSVQVWAGLPDRRIWRCKSFPLILSASIIYQEFFCF